MSKRSRPSRREPAQPQCRLAPRVRGETGRPGRNFRREHGSQLPIGRRERSRNKAARFCAARCAGHMYQTAGLPLVLAAWCKTRSFNGSPSTITSTCSPLTPKSGGPAFQAGSGDAIVARPRHHRRPKGQPWPRLFGRDWLCKTACPSTSSSSGNREEMGQSKFRGGASAKLAKADKPLRTDSIVVSDSLWPQAVVRRSRTVCAPGGILCAPANRRQGCALGDDRRRGPQPARRLCALINDCYDARTGRVKIPGSTTTFVASAPGRAPWSL